MIMKKLVSMILVIILIASMTAATPTLDATKATTATLTYLTKAIYDDLGNYSEGLIWVKEGDTFQYLNKKGKIVIDLSDKKYIQEDHLYITEVGDFHDGLALISLSSTLSDEVTFDDHDFGYYIDIKGNIVLTAAQINTKLNHNEERITDFYSAFSENVTISDSKPTDGQICVVDKKGNHKWYVGICEGYFWFTEELLCNSYYIDKYGEEKWGYVDHKFKKVIAAQFDQARPFNQGLAPVQVDGTWGFINKSGKVVIKAQFNNFNVKDINYSYVIFNEGVACVQKDGKWGGISKTGKTIISFKYESPFVFVNGYARIKGSDGTYTYIDTKGKTIIKTKYDDSSHFNSNGVAVVGNDGVYKIINTAGKKVSDKTWEFDETGSVAMTPDILLYKIGDKLGIAKIH